MTFYKRATWILFLVCSSAASADGGFLAAQVGSREFDAEAGLPSGLGNGGSYRIAGGYRWDAFGIDAGYTDLGSANDLSTTAGGVLRTQELDLTGWTVGVHGRFRLSDRWFFQAKGGLFRWSSDLDLGLDGAQARFDDSGTGWYAGLGIGVDIGQRFSLTLDADRYEAEPESRGLSANVVSLGTEIRF
jgi:OmpA-OmpF porin, OOP family